MIADVLVNNAGMTSVASGRDAGDDVADLSLADWETALSRNLTRPRRQDYRGCPGRSP